MARVVITGIGVLAALGETPDQFFDNLLSGMSGIRTHPAYTLPQSVGYVDFHAAQHFNKLELLSLDRSGQFAVVAARQAMQAAQLQEADPKRQAGFDCMGVFWGSGAGGAETTELAYAKHYGVADRDGKGVATVPAAMMHAAAAQIAMRFGIRGECQTYSTACSSAAVAIGDAYRRVQSGIWPMALAGGSDCVLLPGFMHSWSLMKVLCRDPADAPGTGCRPFSVDRSGFAMGEGAAAFVLESLDSALSRGATIYAELVRYGVSNDATHIVRPDPAGQARAMRAALREARVGPTEVGYINAHGTATEAGDRAEMDSIRQVFGSYARQMPVSSTKSAHGHVMGATGAVELIATVQALRRQMVPPTTHWTACEAGVDMDFVPHRGRAVTGLEYAMSNSFAFGGNNAVLLAKRWK